MNRFSINLCTRKRHGGLFIYLIKAICLIAFLSNSASAAVWLFDPRVILSQEYSDNYQLSTSSSDEDEVWTTKLTGELALRGKSERADLEALLRLDKVEYNGDDDRLSDRNNQLLGFASQYEVTERNKFSLKGIIFRDSLLRTGQIGIVPQAIGDDVSLESFQDLDENLIQDNVRRTRFNIAPSWRHKLNEKTAIGLDYRYRDLSFSGESGTTDLVESDSQSVSGTIRRKITEKDRLFFRVSESYFRPDNDKDVDTLEVKLGWIRDFSETFQMDFTFGGRDSDFDNAAKSSDSGFVANIGATQHTGLTTYRVNLERRVAPSASGNQVEADTLLINVNRMIAENLEFNFNGRLLDTDSTDGSSSRNDRTYISLTPGLRWRFSPLWVASAAYRYSERDLDDGGSGDSNNAYISISYSPPRQFKLLHRKIKY